jgi:hypothetical protein
MAKYLCEEELKLSSIAFHFEWKRIGGWKEARKTLNNAKRLKSKRIIEVSLIHWNSFFVSIIIQIEEFLDNFPKKLFLSGIVTSA